MTNEVCTCAACGQMMTEETDMVQNPVYKCGELSYIELAHRTCLPEWSVNDDWQPELIDFDDMPEPAPWTYVQPDAPAATLADIWPGR